MLIAYDRDLAGEKAATALSKKLIKESIDCYRIQFPKGMDANEYALSVQPASKSLGVVIRSAVWLGKGEAPSRPASQVQQEATATKEKAGSSSSLVAKPQVPAASSTPTKPLPAAVLPKAPKAEIKAEVTAEEVIITLGDRRYRIRGLDKNLSINQLKVNVLASKGEAIHVDTFDLYAAKSRGLFIKQTAFELEIKEEVIKRDLGKVLLKCEALQEVQVKQTLESNDKNIALDDVARDEALALLKSPDLLQRILDDFKRCGVVGEETNKLTGYLACVSRKLDKPLAVIIQSTSAAGKSSLMDAILNLMPEDERVQYSAMTGQSLFYMGETNLKHKILAIAEEEGASTAGYALKLLQSEGVITIASTGKDDSSGDLVTKEYRVEGPVMLFLTTTAIDIDEELMNRCLVLTVNESREQTQAIHVMQRQQETLEGLLQAEDKKHLIQLHRNAQHLLKPLRVTNPFAEQLTFIDDKTRTRRDHMKYLTLIRTIALLHQHQRDIKTTHYHGRDLEYIEATKQDIETANRLAHEVLGRTLDEPPPQTCTLLKDIKAMIAMACKKQGMEQRDYRFSRRDIREATGWSDGQLKIHCHRLTELEYLLIHRGGRGQSLVYELLYDGDLDDKKHLMGLIDPETLHYDEEKLGQNLQKTAPSQGSKTSCKANQDKAFGDPDHELPALKVYDIDRHRAIVIVREGKGRRDRVIPIGERALAWVEKYLNESRPQLLLSVHEEALFLNDCGDPLPRDALARKVKHYMRQAGIKKTGSCHLFRHAMATHMLDNGADTRFIQAMLGHADLATTQIYTHVSVEKLKEIHAATHPAKMQREQDLDNGELPDAVEQAPRRAGTRHPWQASVSMVALFTNSASCLVSGATPAKHQQVLRGFVPPTTKKANSALLAVGLDHPYASPQGEVRQGQVT